MAVTGAIINDKDSTSINATPIASGSASVTPGTTTTYTLTATSIPGGQSVSKTVTVTVEAALNIDTFSATPDTIAPGSSSTLAWTVSGGE